MNATLTQTIDLADFLSRGLEVLDKFNSLGVILTQEGRPVARLTPLATVNNEALIGSMKDQITLHGNIFSTNLEWNAQS